MAMETKKIKYRSHRGGVYYTPENTMPAFLDALEKGFEIDEIAGIDKQMKFD